MSNFAPIGSPILDLGKTRYQLTRELSFMVIMVNASSFTFCILRYTVIHVCDIHAVVILHEKKEL